MTKRVLMIDDDELVTNVFRKRFEQAGFEFEIARDGEAGLNAIKENRPGIVLLDMELPNARGSQILAAIRTNPGTETLPVIVFSNGIASKVAEELEGLDAFRILSKTNTRPAELIAIVSSALENHDEMTSSRTRNAVVMADSESKLHDELRQMCLDAAPKSIAEIYDLLKLYFKNNEAEILRDIYTKVHTLAGNTGLAGMNKISGMAGALEALLKELCVKPQHINFSTDRTITRAVDVLSTLLLQNQARIEEDSAPPAKILVVDDQEIARRAICYALDRAKLKAICAESPQAALDMLAEEAFDLILLDIEMPEMNGWDVCQNLRKIPHQIRTPVIFVSRLSDIEHRLEAFTSGGNDFIGKPFLTIELALRAMSYILLQRAHAIEEEL